MMDIYFVSTVGVCEEFRTTKIKEKKLDKESVSVVISPLRAEGQEGNIKVAHGCNMWRACQNKDCYFSMAARTLPKIKARE